VEYYQKRAVIGPSDWWLYPGNYRIHSY